MTTTFRFTYNGEDQAVIRLYSLDEYETDGGIYDDSGNWGEAVDKADFIAAATVAPGHYSGLADNDLLELAGLERADYWLDSVTDYFLLRRFPDSAPLEARFVSDSN